MAINQRTMLATMVFRSLRNNARVSAWTLLTLATCAALVTLFTTASLEVGQKMSRELRQIGANAVAYPAPQGTADWAKFAKLAPNTVQLTAHTAVIEGKAIAIISADSQKLQALTPYWAVTGTRPITSREALVGSRVANVLQLKIGETLNLAGEPLRIVGISETGDEDDDRVFVTARGEEGYRYVLLSVSGGEQEITQLQKAATPAGIEVKPLRQILHGEESVLHKINLLSLAALGAVVVLTVLGVSASMLARVVERRKEFALLQALGASKSAVVKFLLAESATMGVLAAVLGFSVGTLLAMMVVRQIFHVGIGPRWLALVAALVVTILVSLLAGMIACRRTLRFQTAAALRGE